jgi:hypothetical protein
MYMKNRKKKTVHVFFYPDWSVFNSLQLILLEVRNFLHFLYIYILYVSWDITNNIYLFLTVCDISLMVWEEKLKFFLLLLRTKCHKVGLAIITVGPSHMDEQLVQLFLGPNERFWGGRTVGPLWGTFVTRTKRFWDPVSMDWNVRV